MRFPLWHILLSLLFIVLVALGLGWLWGHGRFFLVPPWHVFLIALAVYRLIRLFSYDEVTDYFRDSYSRGKEGSFRHTLGALLSCPWCTGVWLSFIVVFFYFATPFAYPVILIFAIAALGSSLQLLANLVGWHAEGKKLDVKEEEEVHPLA